MNTFGGAPTKCARCSKPVYMAEEMIAAGKKYHKACLKCTSCSKSLDSTNMTDRDGTIYCKPCYGRQFGPKGYGYGGGAGVLSSEASAAPQQQQQKQQHKSKKSCNNCGAANQGGKFCNQCGKSPNEKPPRPTSKPQLAADICPSCGAPGQLKQFCSQCGFNKDANNNNAANKPQWVADESSNNCLLCNDAFTLTNRRHHCRKCGLLVCNKCSPNRVNVPFEDGKVRVCKQCI